MERYFIDQFDKVWKLMKTDSGNMMLHFYCGYGWSVMHGESVLKDPGYPFYEITEDEAYERLFLEEI